MRCVATSSRLRGEAAGAQSAVDRRPGAGSDFDLLFGAGSDEDVVAGKLRVQRHDQRHANRAVGRPGRRRWRVSGGDFARPNARLRQGHPNVQRLYAVVGFLAQHHGVEGLVFVAHDEPPLRAEFARNL